MLKTSNNTKTTDIVSGAWINPDITELKIPLLINPNRIKRIYVDKGSKDSMPMIIIKLKRN